jgi:predicted glycoside hydrolase/deacetylase ChbG (UPF0249 family)
MADVEMLSSELLGFKPDVRLLIVNCDDFGMHEAVNSAVIESIESGIASSCSLIVPAPGAADAMRLLRDHPHIPFGIHLALIREHADYRWGPSAAKSKVPSLLDPLTSELYVDTPSNRALFLRRAQLPEVELELRSQISPVFDAGLSPSHIDWHCLADGGRADIFKLGLSLADEYGLASRVWLEDGRRQARERGKPVVDNVFVDSFSVSLQGKAGRYARMLRDLSPGLNEWAIHPAHGTKEWQAIDRTGWRVRQSDYEFLVSPTAREILAREGIIQLDYRLLQKSWQAQPARDRPRLTD